MLALCLLFAASISRGYLQAGGTYLGSKSVRGDDGQAIARLSWNAAVVDGMAEDWREQPVDGERNSGCVATEQRWRHHASVYSGVAYTCDTLQSSRSGRKVPSGALTSHALRVTVEMVKLAMVEARGEVAGGMLPEGQLAMKSTPCNGGKRYLVVGFMGDSAGDTLLAARRGGAELVYHARSAVFSVFWIINDQLKSLQVV